MSVFHVGAVWPAVLLCFSCASNAAPVPAQPAQPRAGASPRAERRDAPASANVAAQTTAPALSPPAANAPPVATATTAGTPSVVSPEPPASAPLPAASSAASGERGASADAAAPAAVASARSHGGGLSAAQIADVVNARYGAFRTCYQLAAIDSPGLRGQIAVEFLVAPDGHVDRATVRTDNLGSPRLASCLLQEFERLEFPSAYRPTGAYWPLIFRPKRP